MLDHDRVGDSDNSLTLTDVQSGADSLSAARCLQIHRLMVRARALEERMIHMTKSGQSFFWIGGPGEEALNVPLGLQIKKGHGPQFDYLHMHYRNSGTMLAMGMPMIDAIRQAAMRVTDPYSMGRNFIAHYAYREWNVIPVTSVIEVQFSMAAGTALMQKRCEDHDGVTIVTGGDAGAAEGDFASCLVWSTRPGNEVPVLMLVTNNGWGISTPADTQHGERNIADRGKPFGIPSRVVDGNDPIISWHAIDRAMHYCRRNRRPYLLEANVSRLYGHSSASGAERVKDEPDCIKRFEKKLLDAGVIDQETIDKTRKDAHAEAQTAADTVADEPEPTIDDVLTHTYAPSRVDVVYPQDFTGLPA